MKVVMEESRRTLAFLLAGILILTTSIPISMADTSVASDDVQFIGTLTNFVAEDNGKAYLFTPEGDPIYSATRHLKNAWIDAGYPGLVLPFSDSYIENQTTSGRACESAWSQGDTTTMPTASGAITVNVARVTASAAFMVQTGRNIPSTTMNNLASTWDGTIYPTDVSYFGTPPDVDNNCQIEIVIFAIDGGGGTGGYFSGSIAGSREAVFMDIDDLSWGNVILAHEFQHLLHNSRDPFEYIWIDEGNADMAAFLCFGAESTLIGHSNSWTSNASMSLRWWNQRLGDYGGGFLMMLYLADKFGGGQAIQSLVADQATGAQGIERLARNPVVGAPANVGTDFDDIFANFTAAVTLDSQQGRFGLSNIDMSNTCSSAAFCRIQITDQNQAWSGLWESNDHDMEGWGVRIFRFVGGTGAPLNLMVSPSEFGFDGAIVKKDAAAQTWSMDRMRFDPGTGIGTAVVPGFGNSTDEVYMMTWYASTVDDCDYTSPNCAFPSGSTTYPTATIDVRAGLITEPATVRIDSIAMHDRDNDGMSDTAELQMLINSTAFFEMLEVEVGAYINNTLMDSITLDVAAGGGTAAMENIWFTAPWDGHWTFKVSMFDGASVLVDEAASLPTMLYNMRPVAASSAASNTTQTYLDLQFYGAGWDEWGMSQDNLTWRQNSTPVGYAWDFDDGSSSGLKEPKHDWQQIGTYNVTSRVKDIGGSYSNPVNWTIRVNDSEVPIPRIHVGQYELNGSHEVLTDQSIRFDARLTEDNVPTEALHFTWWWGDGTSDAGIGLTEISHSWSVGSADGTAHQMILTIFDGIYTVNKTINIIVRNRHPRQIWNESLVTYTLTPLPMPLIFVDDDGAIQSFDWTFDEAVNIDGGRITLASGFTVTETDQMMPTPAWNNPGWKTINVTATDDDGNMTTASILVQVLNQRPVALFERPTAGAVTTEYAFRSESFDPDGDDSKMTIIWNVTGFESEIVNQTLMVHTFDVPGTYRVTLTAIDELGLTSLQKSYSIIIENPIPLPAMQIREASMNGSLIEIPGQDDSTYTWWNPHTDSGGLFVAPGTTLRFLSNGSRDGDPQFAGMYSSDINSQNWNGLTDYIWDFGDASPPVHGSTTWHSYSEPGIYIVTLTVRDGFGSGDTNVTSTIVRVSSAPVIMSDSPILNDYAIVGDTNALHVMVADQDIVDGILAWRDTDIEVDNNGDGILDNDPNVAINEDLRMFWDLDELTDSNSDGDSLNDWTEVTDDTLTTMTWNRSGRSTIVIKVCDGTDVCTTKAFTISIRELEEDDSAMTLADFEFKDVLPSGESSLFIALLILLVLVLGYFVMRAPTEEEVISDDIQTYDVTEVQAEGGILGMDQHTPPKKPKSLSKGDRTARTSGYIRPVGMKGR